MLYTLDHPSTDWKPLSTVNWSIPAVTSGRRDRTRRRRRNNKQILTDGPPNGDVENIKKNNRFYHLRPMELIIRQSTHGVSLPRYVIDVKSNPGSFFPSLWEMDHVVSTWNAQHSALHLSLHHTHTDKHKTSRKRNKPRTKLKAHGSRGDSQRKPNFPRPAVRYIIHGGSKPLLRIF